MNAQDPRTATASRMARNAILARLREVTAEPPPADDEVTTYFNSPAAGDADNRVRRFVDHARAWQAEVVETDADTWPQALSAVLRYHQVQRLLAGRDSALAATLAATPLPSALHWFDEDLAHCKADLFERTDAGITTTLAGIAETGSLLLRPGPAEPRTLSLIPPVHIAVLREIDIRESLLPALRDKQDTSAMPTNLVLVTGPSKTADIQRMLVYGVHGPRALVILLLREDDRGAAA